MVIFCDLILAGKFHCLNFFLLKNGINRILFHQHHLVYNQYIEFSNNKYSQIIKNVLETNENIVTIVVEDNELYDKNMTEINYYCIKFKS